MTNTKTVIVNDYVVKFEGTLDTIDKILQMINRDNYTIELSDLNDNNEFKTIDFIPMLNNKPDTARKLTANHFKRISDYIVFHSDGSINVFPDHRLPEIYKD